MPRAYGGVDGPQVSLCTTCHTRIHKVAGCLMRKLPYFELTQGLDSEQLKKTLYLATCIMNAESMARNDPNKKTVVVLSLMGGETAKLDKLKKALAVPSREAVLKVALDSLYKKHFIE